MKYELTVHIWDKEAAGRAFSYLTIGSVVSPLVCDWPPQSTTSCLAGRHIDMRLGLSESPSIPACLHGENESH